ncbi:MAG: TlpA family protein disulfide reductase [Candidatus Kapaibacteriota bacterium]|jgi:thiol-disulfide isomerase/thioredoxin
MKIFKYVLVVFSFNIYFLCAFNDNETTLIALGKYYENIENLSYNCNFKYYINNELKNSSNDTILIKRDKEDKFISRKIRINSNRYLKIYNKNMLIHIDYLSKNKYIHTNTIRTENLNKYVYYSLIDSNINFFTKIIVNNENFDIKNNNDTIFVSKFYDFKNLDLNYKLLFKIYNNHLIELRTDYFYYTDSSFHTSIFNFNSYDESNINDSIFEEEIQGYNEVVQNTSEDVSKIVLKLRDKFLNSVFYTYNIKNLNNEDVKLEVNGKHKIIFFWGTWCGACKLAFNPLNEFIKLNGNKFEVISISVKEPNDTNQLRYIKGKNFQFTFLKNGDLTADYYGLTSYPSFVILNKDLKIEDFAIGYFENFNDYLQYLNNELK